MTAPAAVARRRATGVWLAIGVGLVIVGGVAAVIAGIDQLPAHGLLDPEAATPSGSRALTNVLESQGVEVVVARDRRSAETALAHGPATLAIADTAPLSDAALEELSAAAADLVLLEPRSRDLRVLLAGATTAGVGAGTADPACDLAEAQRAGALSPGTVFAPGPGTTACYPSGDGHGLLVRDAAGTRTVAVDATALFTNEHLVTDGNAGLALNLLGRHAVLVWYLPSLADSDLADTSPSIGDLTPDWVTPAIALLALAAAAAGIWRGRRFGPLVAESLPVTVRAGETTAGRARLYARAGDPGHAADELRIGALRRIARALGLGPAASAPEISDAAAARLGADRAMLRALLLDDVPATDRDLVDLADRLRALEAAVTHAVHPERNRE